MADKFLPTKGMMFEYGARIDDIMNVLKPPVVEDDDDNDKKNHRVSDTVILFESKASPGECSIRFEFAGQRNLEGLP